MAIRGSISLDDQEIRPDCENVPTSNRPVVSAVDLSGPSTAAAEYASVIAARAGARLYLVHVVDPVARGLAPIAESEDAIADVFALAERRVHTERKALGLVGSEPVEVVRAGSAARELASFAKEKCAQLVVTGTHERAGLVRVFRGSMAGSILELSPCPVLVVREGARPPARHGLAKVLAAVDGTASSLRALRAALDLAPGAEVHAIHVGSASLQEIDGWLGPDRERVTPLLRAGDPGPVIARVADEGHYDLIACGTHGVTGARAIAGSVARHLIDRAACPALVVREAPST